MKMSKGQKLERVIYFLIFLFVALAATIGLNANYAWAQEGEGEDESAEEDKKVEEDLDIKLDMKKMGIGLEYKRETLEKVKSPPDKIDNLSVGAMLTMMSGDNISSMMYGGLFGWQRLNPSGNFPGIEGGKRHCFSNEVFALLLLGQMKSEVETVDTSSGSYETKKEEKTTSMTMIGGAYSPSWVYLKFGPMDEATLKQKGWLFKLGIMLGFMYVSVEDEDVGDMDSTMPLIGPNVGFGFPKYNAGTAKMTVLNIFGYILPLGDTTIISINMNYQW